MVNVERIQTGVRLERNLVKVLKGLAEYLDMSLGDLLEGICLHAFEGKPPFGPAAQAAIDDLKRIYGLTLSAAASHRLVEVRAVSPKVARARGGTSPRARGPRAVSAGR